MVNCISNIHNLLALYFIVPWQPFDMNMSLKL